MELIGTTTDWKGLEKAKADYWEKLGPHQFHCKLHNTYFDPNGYEENDFEDAEPCWKCYNKFEMKL